MMAARFAAAEVRADDLDARPKLQAAGGGVQRDRQSRAGARFRRVPLGDAGGEQAEIVGQGAVGELGDACAQNGDRLLR
jgi:hypothetical protein